MEVSSLIDWQSRRSQLVRIPGARSGVQDQTQSRFSAAVRREAKRRDLKVHVNITGGMSSAIVRITGPALKIEKGEHEDIRIVTFPDGYQVRVQRGWTRHGGAGWICGIHSLPTITQAAERLRRFEQQGR